MDKTGNELLIEMMLDDLKYLSELHNSISHVNFNNYLCDLYDKWNDKITQMKGKE